jgi:penicillin-insensitive murein DD-endopeptidase
MAVPIQDARKFFVLPQGYEGGGYYTYGTPGDGQSQYAHPALISALNLIAFEWSALDERKFGVGNISLANGVRTPDHKTHRSGLEVDIRPLRTDGLNMRCNFRDKVYDRDATKKLIGLFWKLPNVSEVLFNDPAIGGGVRYYQGHDDHFHVSISLAR